MTALPAPENYRTWQDWARALMTVVLTAPDDLTMPPVGPDPASVPPAPAGFQFLWLDEASAELFLANPAYDPPTAPDQVYIDTQALADLAVEFEKLADEAVDTVKIKDAAILAAKIGDLQVVRAKIADLAVNDAKIANLAVTSAKIANLAVGSAHIQLLAVTTALIDNLAVTNAKIDSLAVTSAKIGLLAVTTGKIDDLAVTTLKINDHAVTVREGASQVGTMNGDNSSHDIISITFSVAYASDVILQASASQNYSGAGTVPGFDAQIQFDGVDQVGQSGGSPIYQSGFAMSIVLAAVAAGTHTAKLRWNGQKVSGAYADITLSGATLVVDAAMK